MKIAIYSRKSKLTETGDSIANQISMCQEYAKLHFKNCEFIIYEDEGYSGGNMERPMFKKLIKDVNNRLFDVLMCYRLDRISRNVNDFSNTLRLLEYNNIDFVSISEQFDTSTPLGKAMLSISSVFAELERDTIAQRITDNFTELAKTGRFLTGRPPEGFKLKRMADNNGKNYNILETIPEEAEKIKLIFKKYLEWESVTKIETYCMQNAIKTKAGVIVTGSWVSNILTHQLYATADKFTYEYFKALGSTIISDYKQFDGAHGITIFRRTKKGKSRHNAPNEPTGFIVGVGGHEGLISSSDWLRVQEIFIGRKKLWVRKATGAYGILNGMLKCSHCGAYMRPVCIRNGKFHYTCITKEKSRQMLCKIANLNHTTDNDVVKMIADLLNTKGELSESLKSSENRLKKDFEKDALRSKKLTKQINDNEQAINNLVMQLSKIGSEILIDRITSQVEKLENEVIELKKDLLRIEEHKQELDTFQINLAAVKNAAEKLLDPNFSKIKDTLVKRNIIKTIVKEIHWNGKELNIIFFSQ